MYMVLLPPAPHPPPQVFQQLIRTQSQIMYLGFVEIGRMAAPGFILSIKLLKWAAWQHRVSSSLSSC